MAAADLPRAEEAGAADAASTPAAAGPVGAVEADVERETKRVATVVPEATPAADLAREEPGASRPGRIDDPAPPATLEDAARTSRGGSGDGPRGPRGIPTPFYPPGTRETRPGGFQAMEEGKRPWAGTGAGGRLARAGPGAEGVLAVVPVAVGPGG